MQKERHMRQFIVFIFFGLLTTKVFSANPVFVDQNCTNTKIIYSLSYAFLSGQAPTTVEYHSNRLIQALTQNCTPGSGLNVIIDRIEAKTKSVREKGAYKVLSQLNSGRNKCDFKFKDVVAAKHFTDDYPGHIKPIYAKKLKNKLKQEISYLRAEGEDCIEQLNEQFQCSPNSSMELDWLLRKASKRSIREDFYRTYEEIVTNCQDMDYAPGKQILKQVYFKKIVPKSLRAEFKHLKYRYQLSIGIEDSNKIKEQMLKIGEELNDNDLILQVYRLPAPGASSVIKDRLRKRKESCHDIDLTHYYNSPNGKQGGVGYCYGFTSAGIINNALGIDNVNPLYLHILNISAHSEDYSLQEEGGFNTLTSALALKQNTYCSTSDLLNPWTSNYSTSQAIGFSLGLMTLIVDNNMRESVRRMVFNNYASFFSELFPKMDIFEFLRLTEGFKGTAPQLLRKLVMSQCTTPFPEGREKIKVENSLFFNASKIDQLLNSGQVVAFNHQYSGLFRNNPTGLRIPDHTVLMTGRKWNGQKNRCEYRIVNSHGNECHNVIQNEDVSCTNHGGMWVSESYLRLMHFSHDYATGQLPSREPYDPAMDPDAIE